MRGRGGSHGVRYLGSEPSVHCTESHQVFVVFILVRIVAPPRVWPTFGLTPVQNRYLPMLYAIWFTVGMYSR